MNKLRKIVFASHTYIGGPFVVGSHQLAIALSKQGHSIMHVSSPLTPYHLVGIKKDSTKQRFKIARRWKSNIEDRVINYIPFSLMHPGFTTGNMIRNNINPSIATSIPSMKKVIKYFGFNDADVVILDQPMLNGIEKLFNERGCPLIYRATDLYAEMSNSNKMVMYEKEIINKSNALIATSKPVMDRLLQYSDSSKPSLIIENGVDYEHFAVRQDKPREYMDENNKIAVYIGAIDERLDIDLIVKTGGISGITIYIIGPYDQKIYDRIKHYNHIKLLGPRSYSQIPSYMQYADIGLLPLSNHKANIGRSPMKLYEYAAAGLPVIARRTEELERRNEPFLYLYDEDDFYDYLKNVSFNEEERAATRERAQVNSWKHKAKIMSDFIDAALSSI